MTNAAAPPAPHPLLRLALAVVAAAELLDAISGVPNIFTDYHHATAALKFAQALTSVKLALAPLLAAAALVLAALGRLRLAILTLAALVLSSFVLDDLPSLPIAGLGFTRDAGGVNVVIQIFLLPAAAAIGAWLAWKERRLALAGLLVSLPTLYHWLAVAAFTAAVAIFGF